MKIWQCRASAYLGDGRLALATMLLLCSMAQAAQADTPTAPLVRRLPNLPLGSRCLGTLPCAESGDYGIHLRGLGVLALDENHQIIGGRFEPGLMLSAMEVGECGVSFPLRFYELGLPVPERVRLFCKGSLPKGLLPTSHGAAFVSMNLASGPFDEARAPGGPRSTTVDVGAALGGDVLKILRLGTTAWATLGEGQPELHAGAELLLRTDFVALFGQVQFENRVGCGLSEPLCAWGFLGLLGASVPLDAVPTSAYVGLGRGQAQPWMIVALQGGATYDVAVRKRVGDGHQAVEHWWLKQLYSYRYRLHLKKLGYRDPIVNARGGIDEDDGSALIGWLGQPHPTMPGYILSWEGLPVRVGSHVYIREDWPLVTSEEFPGWVLTYLPQVRLQQLGQPDGFAPLDDGYFNRLQVVRAEEERRLRDTMRNVPTPWLKAGLNALTQVGTAPILLLLSGASPDTASFSAALHQTRLLPYRTGQEEHKGEIAETVIGVYSGMLGPWASGAGRVLAASTFRELGGALTTLRDAVASERVGLGWLSGLRVETTGLGSNFGNLRIRRLTVPAAEIVSTAEDGAAIPFTGPRMRHYTSASNAKKIEQEGVLRASSRQWNSGSVYCERAAGKPLSPTDAVKRYGLRDGRGSSYIEFSIKPEEATRVTNPITGQTEWVIQGDISLSERSPSFHRR